MHENFKKYKLIRGLRCLRAIIVALVTLALLIISRPISAQSIVSFGSLAPGTILSDQLKSQGVKFVPYAEHVTATIIATPAGNVADFNHCEGGMPCEFWFSGARGIFIDQHRFVKVHVGLITFQGKPFETQLSLTAYDANGQEVGSSAANVVAGTGFSTEILVTSATANIASFILKETNDPSHSADIGMLDLEFDPVVVRVPDFILETPQAVTVVAGGPAIDVPITISRLGDSTGGIDLSATNLPSNVVATFLPPQAPGSSAAMRLSAPANQSNSTSVATVTGTPATPSAGGSQRSHNLYVNIEAGLSLYGPSVVDLSACKTVGLQGSVVLPFTVLRHPTISGPVTLAVSNLPPGVSYSLSPSSLNFAGWAIGGSSTLTLTASAGIQIPDTVVQIELTNGSIHENFGLLVHGTCPRQNKNFIMRGVFRCNNRGLVEPLANAEVEFFRYRSLWSDDRIGSTITNADGSYETNVWTSIEGDFYARLRLNDPGKVYLEEAINSSVWSKDTERKSNKDPILDFGQWTIYNDGGQGTPKCAIWQGAQHAYREFNSTVGQDPPIGNYEILMWKTIQVPYSFLSTTNWLDNYPTGYKPTGNDLFRDYETSFHEFGHTVRQTYDGDWNHFINDASQYTYARSHNYCDMTNEGFAFNEGWAEYWSKEPQHGNVCDKTPPIFSIEGVVAEDLNYLANCTGVDRKGMIAVLQRGRNIIHTDKEFREEFQKQFPNIDLTKCPPLSPARALLIPRERLKTLRDLRYGIPASSSSGAIAAGSSAASVRQPVDNATLVAALRADMDAQVQVTNQLRKDLDDSIKVAAEPGVCPAVSCELVAERVVRPDRLRGAIELSEQLQRRMEADLATLHSGDRSGPQFPKDFEAMRLATKITFESERKEIVKRSLDRAINALAPLVARDTTGALAEQSGQLARQVRLLEMRTPTNDAYLTFLKLPRSARDDGLELATAAHSQWSVKRIVLIVALVLLGILLLSVLVWLTKRLSA